jgi:signal transduction histidine kinase/CheY-like chemotaxis protein
VGGSEDGRNPAVAPFVLLDPTHPMSRPDLAEIIRERRAEIVARFVAEVRRKDLPPRGVSSSLLVDHIPRFLDEVATEVSRLMGVRMSADAVDASETARMHGEQRWTLGYDLQGLIREYDVLRRCILGVANEAGAHDLSSDESEALAKCLGVGIAEAVDEYVTYRDEQLNEQKTNLEFLVQAGELLSSSLDYRSTLSRLTGLLIPRVADWCVVHLAGTAVDEIPIAHVDPAKVEILRDMYRRYSMLTDSPYGYPQVRQTGQAEFVPLAPALVEGAGRSEEQLELMRRVHPCSWMIVPLLVQGNILGTLTLAYSDSGRHFDTPDLVLANELARRAAVAIDNAKLYELSQRERSRVESATRAKDEFVAIVSHELRTPLNAILGWMRLLRSGSLPESKREHAFEVIERNAKAQSQLVSDLLDISRSITGKIRIHPSQMDFANVIEMAIEAVRPAADAKRIEIDANLDRSNAVMRGDGDRLQQVVWNLLANAVKFTPKSGRVTVKLQHVDSDLQLIVEDNGAGIDGSFLPHVFELFRQSETGASRPHGGLGLGLSIAKHIVELHGGTIEAESAGPGRGATFVVRLPISPLVSTSLGVPRVPATTEHVRDSSPPVGLEGLHVLVVDDDPDARDLMAYLLGMCGAVAHLASSAAEALAELEKNRLHLVLSDIGMPGEDGFSLIRSIRTLPSEDQRTIPAIALTAFARNEDRTRALVEGFNLYIAKPVEPSALMAAIAELAGHIQR